MSLWPVVHVKDIAETFDGPHATPGSTKTATSGPVFLGISSLNAGRLDLSQSAFMSEDDFAQWTRRVTPTEGDVVFSYETRLGQAAMIPSGFRGSLGRRLALMRPNRGRIDPRFLLYYFLGPAFQEVIRKHTVQGSTVDRIMLRDFPDFPVELPPLDEQRAIAEVLTALDDKIESNRRAMKIAFELARAFVDDVTAGRPRVSLTSTMTVRMGSAFKGDSFSAPGVGRPLLRIRDLKTFESAIWTTERRIDETVIRAGDIVVGMDAEFRATLWNGGQSVLNQRVCSFVGLDGIGRAYVLAALEPELARQERSKSGTTVIHLNKADIDTFEVPELSMEEHLALSRTTEPLIDLIVTRGQEIRTLARMRDALLPELLSGRVGVAEAREAVA